MDIREAIGISYKDMEIELEQKLEETITKAVQNVDVTVNKEKVKELLELNKTINTNELGSTVKDMVSDNYKKRFKAEYNQAVIRRDKLFKIIDKYTNKSLCFKPNSNIWLLKAQLDVMNAYIDILRLRAKVEELQLDYPPRVGE